MGFQSFGLHDEPFGVTPDPRFFHSSEQHREAAATLLYAVKYGRGCALLIGRAGLGKTTIIFRLMDLLGDRAVVAYLAHPFFDRYSMLGAVLTALNIAPGQTAAQNHQLLHQKAMDVHNAGKTCVVVFDEAQCLDRDTLEAIRLLSNFETPERKLIQIILAGQSELLDTLRRDDCEQIRQRMTLVARVEPMTCREVEEYIKHRLRMAGGCAEELFTPDAIRLIAAESAGIPRNVNALGFNSMTVAYASNRKRVERNDVLEAAYDRHLQPTPLLSAIPTSLGRREPQSLCWSASACFGAALAVVGLAVLCRFLDALSNYANVNTESCGQKHKARLPEAFENAATRSVQSLTESRTFSNESPAERGARVKTRHLADQPVPISDARIWPKCLDASMRPAATFPRPSLMCGVFGLSVAHGLKAASNNRGRQRWLKSKEHE